VDRTRVGQWARQPRLQLPRPAGRHRPVDGPQKCRRFLTGQGLDEFQARAARRIDRKTGAASSLWRSNERFPTHLSQVDVLQNGSDRGKLGPRKCFLVKETAATET